MSSETTQRKFKLTLLILIIALIAGFYFSGASRHLELEQVKANLDAIQNYYQLNPVKTVAFFTVLYVFLTGLSIPGAIVLTLLSGAIFSEGPEKILNSLNPDLAHSEGNIILVK